MELKRESVQNAPESKESVRVSGEPIVLLIKAGLASSKSLKIILPEDMRNASINDVIKYALEQPTTRKYEDRAETIRNEMKSDYGITANGAPVNGEETIADYIEKKEVAESNISYQGVELVVASEQEGGLEQIL